MPHEHRPTLRQYGVTRRDLGGPDGHWHLAPRSEAPSGSQPKPVHPKIRPTLRRGSLPPLRRWARGPVVRITRPTEAVRASGNLRLVGTICQQNRPPTFRVLGRLFPICRMQRVTPLWFVSHPCRIVVTMTSNTQDRAGGTTGLKSLSPSRASDYKRCPQLFKFSAIDRIPTPPTVYQARGTTAHLALAATVRPAPTAERTPDTPLRPVPRGMGEVQADRLPGSVRRRRRRTCVGHREPRTPRQLLRALRTPALRAARARARHAQGSRRHDDPRESSTVWKRRPRVW